MTIQITKQDIVSSIQALTVKLGRVPTMREFGELGICSTTTVRNRLGSWTAACQAADVQPVGSGGQNRIPDTEYLERLQSLSDNPNNPPEPQDYIDEFGHPVVIYRRWSNWANALVAAGFKATPVVPIRSKKILPSPFHHNHIGWNDELGCEFHQDDWTIDCISSSFGHWLAGFFCGEGFFRLSVDDSKKFSVTSGVSISVRDDDVDLLVNIRDTLQLPSSVTLYSNQYRRDKGEQCADESKLGAYNVETLHHKIVPLFERYPIHGKKGKEFEMFAEAIKILHCKITQRRRRKAYTEQEMQHLTELTARITAVRQHPVFGSSKANR